MITLTSKIPPTTSRLVYYPEEFVDKKNLPTLKIFINIKNRIVNIKYNG